MRPIDRPQESGARLREAGILAAIALASLTVRAAFALTSDVLQDEVIYWWTSKEAPAFTPHPPAVPLILHWSELALGRGLLAVRLGSLVWGTAAVFMAYVLGQRLYNRRAGLWAAALLAACPLFVGLGSLATPDSPLVFLWLLLTYAVWRAAENGRGGWWLAAGIILGGGLYTKYMAVLAVPAMAFVLWAREPSGWRAVLRHRGLWTATGVGFALFLPLFVAWNARHGWTSLRYHLSARHHWTFSWEQLGIYFGLHAAFLSPVLLLGVLAAFWNAWRGWRRRGEKSAVWVLGFGLIPIVLFVAPSVLTARVMTREHWDAFGYAVGLVGLAGFVTEPAASGASARRRALGVWVLITALVMSILAVGLSIWPGAAVRLGLRPPTLRMLGWRELAAGVRGLQERWNGGPPLIATDSFGKALALAFHLDRREGIYTLRHNRNERYGLTEQLGQWGIDEEHLFAACRNREVLFVFEHRIREDGSEDQPNRIYDLFQTVEKAGDVDYVCGGRRLKHFGLYRCRGLKEAFAEAAGAQDVNR